MSTGKDAILASARKIFAQHGFRGTTMRMIASDAQCDVALLAYHFGNKQQLFTAAIDPNGLTTQVRSILENTPLERIGTTVCKYLVTSWETPEGEQVLAGIRGIIEHSAEQISPLGMTIWGVLSQRLSDLGIDHPEERIELIMATIIGASTMRKLAKGSKISTLTADEFVSCFAPTIQRLVTDPLFQESHV